MRHDSVDDGDEVRVVRLKRTIRRHVFDDIIKESVDLTFLKIKHNNQFSITVLLEQSF